MARPLLAFWRNASLKFEPAASSRRKTSVRPLELPDRPQCPLIYMPTKLVIQPGFDKRLQLFSPVARDSRGEAGSWNDAAEVMRLYNSRLDGRPFDTKRLNRCSRGFVPVFLDDGSDSEGVFFFERFCLGPALGAIEGLGRARLVADSN